MITPTYDDRPGVWLLYDYDSGPYAQAIYASPDQAARAQARQGYGRVGFWPLGLDLREAVDWWEGREHADTEPHG